MTIAFNVKVKAVAVKEKIVKHDGEEEAIRVGTLTLEFDADDVDTNEVVLLIAESPVILGLANSQMRLDDVLNRKFGVESERVPEMATT